MITAIRLASVRRPRWSRALPLACAAMLAIPALASAGQGAPHSAPPPDPVSSQSAQATVSTHDLLARLNQPWVQLIDVRSADEYAGRDIRALRGGHIPGARNVPIARDTASGGIDAAFAPQLDTLDRRKETVVYGHRAVDAAPAAQWLQAQGFRHVRVYAGAWQTWGNRLELPVADERFADVAALRERITELQRTVERLSPRLAGR